MLLTKDLFAIASTFEEKIKIINDTYRSYHEEWFNSPGDAEECPFMLPDDVKMKLQSGIQDLYLYILENYNKLPQNQRIEIKYYYPFTDNFEEMSIRRAIWMVFSFYLDILKDLDLVTDPNAVKFGDNVIDNFIIKVS